MNAGSLVFDVVFSFFVLVYIAIVYNEKREKIQEVRNTELKDFNKLEEVKSEEIVNQPQINYQNFQLLLAAYALFLGMCLTGWEEKEYSGFRPVVRTFQACVLTGFYIWTLAAPFVLTDRSFNR